MNDTVTILGFIGNEPNGNTTTTGVPVVNFRVGSSQRRYDAKTQAWVDTGTNWYSVSAYRQLAEHAKASLRKGDPVIVTGRLKLREWDNGNGARGSSLDLDADAIGHDLRWGSSAFIRPNRGQSAPSMPASSPSADPFAPTTDVDGQGSTAQDAEDGTADDGEDRQPVMAGGGWLAADADESD